MTIYHHIPASLEGATEQAPTPNRGGSISVTMSNGDAVTEHRGNAQYQHANIARDAYGADSWKGTATTTRGQSTADITRDTLVTINGVQARVQDFVSMGELREVSPGQFEANTGEASSEAPQVQPVEVDNETPPLANDVNAFVGDLLSTVPPHAVEPLMNSAAHAVATGGSMDSVAAQLATSVPGMSPEEAAGVIGYAVKAYQNQADAFLSAPGRVGKENLESFYAHVRKDPVRMQQAITQQRQGSMAGWQSLVGAWQDSTPPQMRSLEAAGYEVRNVSGTPEVKIGGLWCSVHGAARAGLI